MIQTVDFGNSAHKPLDTGARSIPSLDGLRAISCLLVVLAHGAHSLPPTMRAGEAATPYLYNAPLGVYVFFVISGFLITMLLLDEHARSGTINLTHFYLRRSFRIFPPFYAYLAVTAAVSAVGWLFIPPKMFLAAGTYLWNYLHWSDSWFLGHLWSLSVEEQFYIVWPALLLFLGPKRAKWCALGIIALSPLIRTASYFLSPGSRPYIAIMLHTRADTLMFGCVLALCWKDAWLNWWRRMTAKPAALAFASAFLLVGSPFIASKARGAYLLPIGYSLEGACIATLILFFVEHPESPGGRLLNRRGLTFIGRMSYSVYLWQQLFLTDQNILSRYPPAQFVAAFAVALASYNLIEKPCLALRKRWVPDVRP